MLPQAAASQRKSPTCATISGFCTAAEVQQGADLCRCLLSPPCEPAVVSTAELLLLVSTLTRSQHRHTADADPSCTTGAPPLTAEPPAMQATCWHLPAAAGMCGPSVFRLPSPTTL